MWLIICVLLFPSAIFALNELPITDANIPLSPSYQTLAVIIIGIIALILLIFTYPVPVAGPILAKLSLLPVLEEVIFRFIFFFGFLIQLIHCPDYVSLAVSAVIFAVLHLFIPPGPISGAPPGFQVGEALFVGTFNGLMLINLMRIYLIGNLTLMIYLWLFHIMVNIFFVLFNLVVNFILGGNPLIHAIPRLTLGSMAAILLIYCWINQTVDFPEIFG